MLHTNCEWSKFSDGDTWWRPLASARCSSVVSIRLDRFITGSSFGVLVPFVLWCSRNRFNFDKCLFVTLLSVFCTIWLMIDRSRICTMRETPFFNAIHNRAWWRMFRVRSRFLHLISAWRMPIEHCRINVESHTCVLTKHSSSVAGQQSLSSSDQRISGHLCTWTTA